MGKKKSQKGGTAEAAVAIVESVIPKKMKHKFDHDVETTVSQPESKKIKKNKKAARESNDDDLDITENDKLAAIARAREFSKTLESQKLANVAETAPLNGTTESKKKNKKQKNVAETVPEQMNGSTESKKKNKKQKNVEKSVPEQINGTTESKKKNKKQKKVAADKLVEKIPESPLKEEKSKKSKKNSVSEEADSEVPVAPEEEEGSDTAPVFDSDSDDDEDYFGLGNVMKSAFNDDEDNEDNEDNQENDNNDDEEDVSDDDSDDDSIDSTKKIRVSKEKKEKKEKPAPKEKKEKPKEKNINKDDTATIFVGNLPVDAKANHLKTEFAKFGKIQVIRFRSESGEILRNKKEYKRCTSLNAYVKFENEEQAQKALEMNGKEIKGNIIRVNMANVKKASFHNKATAFVGNIKFDVTDNQLHEYFKQCGEIDYIRRLPKKGVAWVCFKQSTSLPKAFKLNEEEFCGRAIRVSKSTEKRRLVHKKKTKKLNSKLADSKKGDANNKLLNPNVRPNKNPIYEKMNKSKLQNIKYADKKAKFGKKNLSNKTHGSGGQKDKKSKDPKSKKSDFHGTKTGKVEKKKKKTFKKLDNGAKQKKQIAQKLKLAASRGKAKT